MAKEDPAVDGVLFRNWSTIERASYLDGWSLIAAGSCGAAKVRSARHFDAGRMDAMAYRRAHPEIYGE